MRYTTLQCILFFTSTLIHAQSHLNVACQDFTFENKEADVGKTIRQRFEYVLSKATHPFNVLEREQLSNVFSAMQEEQNLSTDLSPQTKQKLQLAHVVYLIRGNIDENFAKSNYDLMVNFIEISGSDVTKKLPFYVSFSKQDVDDRAKIYKILDSAMQVFVNEYFSSKSDSSKVYSIPKVNQELNKRDSAIHYLDSIMRMKDAETAQEIDEIKRYSYISTLDFFGQHTESGSGAIVDDSLNMVMHIIYSNNSGNISLNRSDTIKPYILLAIKLNPNFPFPYIALADYYAIRKDTNKPVVYAMVAGQILHVTTQMTGHNKDHDAALSYLRDTYFLPLGINIDKMKFRGELPKGFWIKD